MKRFRLFAPRATLVAAALVTAAALMLAACSNIFTEKPEERAKSAIPNGFGTVRVSAGIQDAARTAIPAVPTGFDHYEYWFTKAGSAERLETAGAEGRFYLEPGSYTVKVKGFAAPEAASFAGQGTSASFNISAGADAGTVNVSLSPIVGEGQGTLSYTLKYPEGITVETYTLTLLAGTDPINLTSGVTPVTASGVTTLSGSKTVNPAGYYLLQVSLVREDDGAEAGKTEVVHIYGGLTTTTDVAGYTFTNGEFVAPSTVNTTADTDANNVGSLRWAITRNNGLDNGGKITFDLPAGSVITLNSVLPAITKNLVLEGNGVTLAPGASFPAASETSQLLYISDASAEVKISRVHFKDGRTTIYGGAIRNTGTLTVESSIFSGNQTNGGSTPYGGAIYSNGNTVISGSTFYNNSANTGGAICLAGSDKTFTLTGNLFYGNTAISSPVVRKSSADGTLISGGYNMVDVAYGTSDISGNQLTGWVKGGDDIDTVSALSFSPVTFKLLGGSAAAAKLPGTLPVGYPAKDFYGNAVAGNGAAGAVQSRVTNQGSYYLTTSVNNSAVGSVAISSPSPDVDGLYSSNVTLTANITDAAYSITWLVNGVKHAETSTTLTLTLSANTTVQAVFNRVKAVTNFTDGAEAASTEGTLRYALTTAGNGDLIRLNGVSAGTTTIALTSALPAISTSITIEGNGVTLIPGDGFPVASETSQLLRITSEDAVVSISRVHFKGGRVTQNGGAIYNAGTVTVESCIFSDNRATTNPSTSSIGAIYSTGSMTIKGSSFYNNSALSSCGAIYISGSNKTLTLTGNLFYGNTAAYFPIMNSSSVTVTSGGYNVVDVAWGTGNTQSGWAQGTNDVTALLSALPVSPLSFKRFSGSGAAGVLPAALPEGYPAADFYGAAINGNGAAGAVQAATAAGYYLEASSNNSTAGSVALSSQPDADGVVSGNIVITASPESGYSFDYWLVNGVKDSETSATLNLTPSSHNFITAVFLKAITVTDFGDGAGTAQAPTLRYALTNAENGDAIRLGSPNQTIALTSALPQITGAKSITIEGNGLTLTRATSWTTVNGTSQLLYINSVDAVVTIRRVHFKDGRVTNYGGAIRNTGTLTLESCIFSGNQVSGGTNAPSGAIYSTGAMTITGSTFYNNSSAYQGGAIYFSASEKTLTLTGNVFYGNTSPSYPVVYKVNGTVTSGGYNVSDKASGTNATTGSGWDFAGTDTQISALSFSPLTFKVIPGGGAAGKLVTLPEGYPAEDFYGTAINVGGAAGAVQTAVTNSGYFYIATSVNNSAAGSLAVSPSADADGLYASGSVTITATPNSLYSVNYWLVNGTQTPSTSTNTLTFTPSTHTFVKAVFKRVVMITDFSDGAGSSSAPTLRYALTNVEDGDVIEVQTANQTITLSSNITMDRAVAFTIEGKGLTLTRQSSMSSNLLSQLLYINNVTAEVTISRVHFKGGQATNNGAAIYNKGTLTVESCIFSGNTTTSTSAYGGAIYSEGNTTIKGSTFYKNTSGSWGGAIYFSGASGKTLTLTGNLFYGNAATTSPVVYKSSSSSTLTSGGYNVVDASEGYGASTTANNQLAGWAAGTGDTTFSTLSITDDPFNATSIKPSDATNLGKLQIVPTSTAGFPATQFDGTARTEASSKTAAGAWSTGE